MSDISGSRHPGDDERIDADDVAETPVPLDAPIEVPTEDLLDQLHEEPVADDHDPAVGS